MMIKTIERLVSERPFNHRFSHCEANRVESEYLDKKIDHSLKVPMEPTLCSFLGFDFGGTKKMRPADWTHRKKDDDEYTFAGGTKTHFQKIPTSKSDALEDEFTVSDGHVSGCHVVIIVGLDLWIYSHPPIKIILNTSHGHPK